MICFPVGMCHARVLVPDVQIYSPHASICLVSYPVSILVGPSACTGGFRLALEELGNPLVDEVLVGPEVLFCEGCFDSGNAGLGRMVIGLKLDSCFALGGGVTEVLRTDTESRGWFCRDTERWFSRRGGNEPGEKPWVRADGRDGRSKDCLVKLGLEISNGEDTSDPGS